MFHFFLGVSVKHSNRHQTIGCVPYIVQRADIVTGVVCEWWLLPAPHCLCLCIGREWTSLDGLGKIPTISFAKSGWFASTEAFTETMHTTLWFTVEITPSTRGSPLVYNPAALIRICVCQSFICKLWVPKM